MTLTCPWSHTGRTQWKSLVALFSTILTLEGQTIPAASVGSLWAQQAPWIATCLCIQVKGLTSVRCVISPSLPMETCTGKFQHGRCLKCSGRGLICALYPTSWPQSLLAHTHFLLTSTPCSESRLFSWDCFVGLCWLGKQSLWACGDLFGSICCRPLLQQVFKDTVVCSTILGGLPQLNFALSFGSPWWFRCLC